MIENVSMEIGLLKFTLEQFLEPLALSSETEFEVGNTGHDPLYR